MMTQIRRLLSAALALLACAAQSFAAAERPNIIVILADDLGFGDLGSYGAPFKTPHLDQLAAEGFLSTDFFVPANVCSPSRASLLTGRYPMRCGYPIASSDAPKYQNYGLPADELTIPELVKPAGYRTLMVGKWHLGLNVKGSHPLDAGFDEFLGLKHNYRKGDDADALYRGRQVEVEHVPYESLTTRYTDETIRFIQAKDDRPFFIYLAQHIPHLPILPSASFKGKSGKGDYVDFILELDHSTGRILQALRDAGMEQNTLIVFFSDNGPAAKGSAGPLSGGKYVTTDGGHRVPAIIRWPGQIPAGQVSDTTITSMDLLPLFCGVAGVELPADRTIDGKNIIEILRGRSAESPHDLLYYYNGTNLQAVRKGRWKLHLPRTLDDQPFWAKTAGGNPKKIYLAVDEPMLFDLTTDIAEKRNLATDHPDVVAELMAIATRVRAELGDVHTMGSDQKSISLTEPQER